jgi:BolA family transcriptional regulator, general stress-responsive regulator
MCLEWKADKELTDGKKQNSRASRLKKLLEARFSPLDLLIEDQSARHAGHAGAQPEGETHFHIRIVSLAFEGMARVERHRAVMHEAAAEFASGLHALSLDLKTPSEAAKTSS